MEAVPRVYGCLNTIGPRSRPDRRWDPETRVRFMLMRFLDYNLSGVARRIEEGPGRRLRTYWGATSLIENIYSLAADAITGARLRVCEHCSRTFVQTDLRQRFCPPMRQGAKSTCMNTALVRRKRAKAANRKQE